MRGEVPTAWTIAPMGNGDLREAPRGSATVDAMATIGERHASRPPRGGEAALDADETGLPCATVATRKAGTGVVRWLPAGPPATKSIGTLDIRGMRGAPAPAAPGGAAGGAAALPLKEDRMKPAQFK